MLQQLRSLQFKPWEITWKGGIFSGTYIKIFALIKLSGVEKGRAMARFLLFTRTSRSLIAQRLGLRMIYVIWYPKRWIRRHSVTHNWTVNSTFENVKPKPVSLLPPTLYNENPKSTYSVLCRAWIDDKKNYNERRWQRGNYTFKPVAITSANLCKYTHGSTSH